MGKISVLGQAEKTYTADICRIDMGIDIRHKKAAEASKEASRQCELLLSKLQEIGVDPSDIQLVTDSIDQRTNYDNDAIIYISRKTLRLEIPADMKIVNTIRQILEDGFDDISFSTIYGIREEAEVRKELLKAAIADSRTKADFLADSMGLRIIGVDTANLSRDEDVYDLTEDEEVSSKKCIMAKGSDYGLSDMLKPYEIVLNAEVKIVWLLSEQEGEEK